MKYVEKNSKIIFVRNYVGTLKNDDDSKTEFALTCGLNEPIITFPDGSEVILSWFDLYDLAKDYKKTYESSSDYKLAHRNEK